MNPTGAVQDEGRTLVLTRGFAAPIADVWASLTEPDRLERWFGTWSGDPSTGSVLVTLNAEGEDAPPARCEIRTCEPPRLLAVRTSDEHGDWHLAAELSEDDGKTTLVFRQEQLDPASVAEVAAGWEWYLDRLKAAMTGATPPGLAEFEDIYLPMGAAYAAKAEQRRPHPTA